MKRKAAPFLPPRWGGKGTKTEDVSDAVTDDGSFRT